jgi:vacuolar-type H+-ATPase subunit I/STV1
MTAAELVGYLANKPAGADLVYLIVAAVLFGVAAIVAGMARELYRGLVSLGLLGLVLAFLWH